MELTRKAFLAGAAACAAAPAFAKTPDEIRSVLLHWGLNMWGESLPPDIKGPLTHGRLCNDKVKFSDKAWNLLVDDMVDPAGTLTKAANLMLENGALSVRGIASHCVMSGDACKRVQESALSEMIFTDSIPFNKECSKVKILSIAEMFADTIQRVYDNRSISSQYLL